ncbi:hypothetical protein [Deinococcus sp. QL22]|uniref:hypothetical protein n=1 Tax=Deinococcus sp. QL22 TaxID=2939437 RepID=UPI00201723C0|nr:hypothetical protein [Deinococcus sp. QL22]UQN10687.1 hypothetical protein M1R55_30390 [Deinococcus sp. QL22]
MRLKDVRHTRDLSSLPQLDGKAFTLVTIQDYYDGPLTGLVQQHNQHYWYEIIDSPLDGGSRYVIAQIDEEAVQDELYWDHLFSALVCDDRFRPSRNHPPERQAMFYDAYRKRTPLDIENAGVIGWMYMWAAES